MLPKLLIVEDETSARDSLKRTLHKDFEILEAETAEKAFEILSDVGDIAIVMSDENLPGQSGTELLSQVKIAHPKIVRVIVSGKIDLEEMTQAINTAQVHRFILKPWDNMGLRLRLQEALLHHRDLGEIARLEQLAITDPVTGLTNHRFFQERIREEVERAQRHNRVFSLIMIDVDHFKSFNDHFGHPEGDHALAQIARLLKKATRVADTVSRYGGEEFAMILPETPKQAAADVAERIRHELENTAVGGSKLKPHVISLSLGVASFPEHGTTADQIIKASDQALYYAKERGRNRVEVHP